MRRAGLRTAALMTRVLLRDRGAVRPAAAGLERGGFPRIHQRIGELTSRRRRATCSGSSISCSSTAAAIIAPITVELLGPRRARTPRRACARHGRESYYLNICYCRAARYLIRAGAISTRAFGAVRYPSCAGCSRRWSALRLYADRPAVSLIDALDRYLRNGGNMKRDPRKILTRPLPGGEVVASFPSLGEGSRVLEGWPNFSDVDSTSAGG